MKVLVTDDCYWPALGIVRDLGKRGIDVSVLSDSPRRLASHSRYCSNRYLVPHYGDPCFVKAVLDLVRRVQFDLIIPVTYLATLEMSELRPKIEGMARLVVADADKIRAAADKNFSNRLALSLGVPAPRTLCPSNFAEAEYFSNEVRFPVVIKPAGETRYKRGVEYAGNRSELLSYYRKIYEQREGATEPPPLIQEYIPGFGCGFFALYQEGVCKRIFMHRRVREVPPKGGISCCAESFYDPKLKDYGIRLLDNLGWHGVAMVEFRFDTRDNDYKLMEINPKFWGSLDLALTAGADFPYGLCQIGYGQALEYSEEYNRNLRFHWLVNEAQHLCGRPSSIGDVLADLLNPRVKSNIRLDDVWPNLVEPFSRGRARLSRMMTNTAMSAAPLSRCTFVPKHLEDEISYRSVSGNDLDGKTAATRVGRLTP